MKVTTGTIARTVVLVVSLLNVLLNAFGKNPLPFSDDEVYTAVSTVVAVVASLAAWWKNNSFTPAALQAGQTYDKLKAQGKYTQRYRARK